MTIIKLLITNRIDPYFNLATDEYLLKDKDDDFIFLWQNKSAIIVGKHQNTLDEVNYQYVTDNNIPVVRRITGGGAVYHDMGGVNFTVIESYNYSSFGNYQLFVQPVIEYLATLGVAAELNGRNDIEISGKKISGNAQTMSKKRVLHHGTLLFNADLSLISKVLTPSKKKLESKGIESVKSRVGNIKDFTKEDITTQEFIKGLGEFLSKRLNAEDYILSDLEIKEIQELADTKYSTWDWNYGASPEYNLKFDKKLPIGLVDIRLNVVEGIIKNAYVRGDFFSKMDIKTLEEKLVGLKHELTAIEGLLNSIEIGDYISGMTNQDFIDIIF